MILLDILNPADKSEAGLVLAVMMIVSLIIGFVIGWMLRRFRSGESNVNIGNLSADLDQLKIQIANLDKQNIDLTVKNNALQSSLEDCQASKVAHTETASGNTSGISNEYLANAKALGFKAVSGDKKDDLKQIHGVGPFIEKKLNNLGIYTFEQISDFNIETINKVTDAIEFFPGRIERDNWVKQAKELDE